MGKACFLEGKHSSGAATPIPLPLRPTDPLVSGFRLGGNKGSVCPLPAGSPQQRVPRHSQVLHAHPAFAMLGHSQPRVGRGSLTVIPHGN